MLRTPETALALYWGGRPRSRTRALIPARDQVLADLADALVWCGRPSEGQSLAADLLARGAAASTRDQARATVVRGLWLDGRWHELVEQVGRWLGAAEPELTPHARGRMLADQAMACAFGGDAARAEELGFAALRIGEQLDDDAVVFQALQALGPVHNFRGRKPDELAVAERALEIVERGTNPDLVRFPRISALPWRWRATIATSRRRRCSRPGYDFARTSGRCGICRSTRRAWRTCTARWESGMRRSPRRRPAWRSPAR